MAINQFPPSSNTVGNGKQLKFNNVKSLSSTTFPLQSMIIEYNSTYYLQWSPNESSLRKIRYSDGVVVSSLNPSLTANIANNVPPIVIGDFMFVFFGQTSPAQIQCIDLNAMTFKNFNVPITSTGNHTSSATLAQHFDIVYNTGNTYYAQMWLQGATATGIVICTLDTTAANTSIMSQVSFYASGGTGAPPSDGTSFCMLGMTGDLNYYSAIAGVFTKRLISTGASVSSATITGLKTLTSASTNPYPMRALQTASNVIAFITVASQGHNAISINKSTLAISTIGFSITNVTSLSPFLQAYLTKNSAYSIISFINKIYIINDDGTVVPITKSLETTSTLDAQTSTIQTYGTIWENVLSYNPSTKKVQMCNAAIFKSGATLTSYFDVSIREYDIVG